jgi:hypothetical protein
MSIVEFIDELETEFDEKYDTESGNAIVELMKQLKLDKSAVMSMNKFQHICCVLYPLHDDNNHPSVIYTSLKNAGYEPTFSKNVLDL